MQTLINIRRLLIFGISQMNCVFYEALCFWSCVSHCHYQQKFYAHWLCRGEIDATNRRVSQPSQHT
ncbi:hypothetical protein BIW11_10576 [Tropilaelaps mercedesae]|uniref:Uncharacterized protein n=1 Tax=Tropilaelaps mercedesae TaxID=418985 RepID=A0A1V9XEZ7_9ACAR|nr:hypothetical protein BIW11_10576 [Tropilaelaps mercedesae]